MTTAGGAALLVEHAQTPVLAHNVGGFVPGIAIPLVSDTFTAVMITVTGLTTTACIGFALITGEARLRFFPTLVMMLSAGVNGALLTGDVFNLFVFIEVMLLPSYALIAMTGTWRRLGVGRLFVVVNLVTSTILLIGVGLVYGVAGSVNMAVLSDVDADDPRFQLAVGVVLLALAVKAGVVPLHGWLPRAYPATSATVMALFSALHTKVAIYAIFRIHQTVLDGATAWMMPLLVVFGVTMLVGAYGSLGERMIRRSLAWQMIAGVGYILARAGDRDPARARRRPVLHGPPHPGDGLAAAQLGSHRARLPDPPVPRALRADAPRAAARGGRGARDDVAGRLPALVRVLRQGRHRPRRRRPRRCLGLAGARRSWSWPASAPCCR